MADGGIQVGASSLWRRDGRRVALPWHDLHNHTVHCGHASADATVAGLVRQADALHLDWFGFSEHVVFAEDVVCVARIRADLAEMDLSAFSARVLVGVEMDPDPLRMDGSWVGDPGAIDYAVLSPHRVPECGTGHWAFLDAAHTPAELRRYGELWLDWYEACIHNPRVDVLGHPLREPLRLGLITLREDRTLDRAAAILQRAAALGRVFELNNGWCMALRSNGEWEPYIALMRALKDCGMRFACGSDSHSIGDVGGRDGIRVVAHAVGLEAADWFDPGDLIGARTPQPA